MPLENIRAVLVSPLKAGNVGSAARAVANTGLGGLVVVAGPAGPEDLPPAEDPWARAMAAGAVRTLATARVVASLPEATDGCVLCVGLTGRERVREEPALQDLRDAVPGILQAARTGPVALLFGREDHGLSNQELDGCGILVRIPMAPEYPVLNVAAAVLVAGYELRMGLLYPTQVQGSAACQPGKELATVSDMDTLYDRARDVLVRCGFLRRRERQGMVTLRGFLGRSRLQRREFQFLMGALKQLARALPASEVDS